MGQALEVIAGQATAPGATITGLTMNAGNSLTVRNAPLESQIMLLQAWSKHQTAGIFRIRSPKLHDNVQGILLRGGAGNPKPLLPEMFRQPLFPQDELIAEITGSNTAGDIEIGAMLLWYEDLPGVNGRFINPETLMQRSKHILTVENTIATGTAGGYSGEEAIDAETDLLKANTDYALLGYLVNAECGVVRWRSADFGNIGVGGPGDEVARQVTSRWFMKLSEKFGQPLIPVFNSANKGGTFIDVHQDENGTDVIVTTILAELEAGAAPAPAG